MTTDWPDGICNCCNDMSTCCFGLFCPCCLMIDNTKRLDNPDSCCKNYLCCMGPFWVRQTIRRRENMRENCCSDCWTVAFCPLLSSCQVNRALKNDFGTPMPGEGYFGRIAKPREISSQSGASYSQPEVTHKALL